MSANITLTVTRRITIAVANMREAERHCRLTFRMRTKAIDRYATRKLELEAALPFAQDRARRAREEFGDAVMQDDICRGIRAELAAAAANYEAGKSLREEELHYAHKAAVHAMLMHDRAKAVRTAQTHEACTFATIEHSLNQGERTYAEALAAHRHAQLALERAELAAAQDLAALGALGVDWGHFELDYRGPNRPGLQITWEIDAGQWERLNRLAVWAYLAGRLERARMLYARAAQLELRYSDRAAATEFARQLLDIDGRLARHAASVAAL